METEVENSYKDPVNWGEDARPGWSTITMTDLDRKTTGYQEYRDIFDQNKEEDRTLDKEVEEKIRKSLRILKANEAKALQDEAFRAKQKEADSHKKIVSKRMERDRLRKAGVHVATIVKQGEGPMFDFEAIKVGSSSSNFCLRYNDLIYSGKLGEYAKLLGISINEMKSVFMSAANLSLSQFEYLGAFFKRKTSQVEKTWGQGDLVASNS